MGESWLDKEKDKAEAPPGRTHSDYTPGTRDAHESVAREDTGARPIKMRQ